jgi:glycosyltransferase involved in cell wall biosynthesis
VLIATMPYTNITALWAAWLARVPTRIILNEQCHFTDWWRTSTSLKDKLLPRLIRRFYPSADAIVAVSQGVADDVRCLLPPNIDVSVIYNPVVTPELVEMADEPVEHAWFQRGALPVVLGVGRLTAQKDFPTLLRAFAIVRRHRPVRLVILGEGEDRAKLEALVRELQLEDSVSLPGFVQNPFKYMRRAAVFALSSIYEGLPTVIAESLATGTPVVSTDCKSGPDEILRGGRDGPLVPVGNVQALAEAIDATLATPPDSRALQERASAFSLHTVTDHYLRLVNATAAITLQTRDYTADRTAKERTVSAKPSSTVTRGS